MNISFPILCVFSDGADAANLASTDILAEALVDENGTWTIQVIYPDNVDPNSQLLNTSNELISVEDFAQSAVIDDPLLETDNTSTQIFMTREARVSKFSASNDESFACTKCNKIYNARRNLVRHMNSECGKEPKYTCIFCDYKNYRRNEIINHIKKKHKKHSEKYVRMS